MNSEGTPIKVGRKMTADEVLQKKVACVERGEAIGDVRELFFRDPDHFRAGELHSHSSFWETIAERNPSTMKTEVLGWIRDKVSIFPYFQHFTGFFKGERYDSDRPPKKLFRNNMSCKSFANFVRKTLLYRLTAGAISLLGKVGDVQAPHIVLALTVEPFSSPEPVVSWSHGWETRGSGSSRYRMPENF